MIKPIKILTLCAFIAFLNYPIGCKNKSATTLSEESDNTLKPLVFAFQKQKNPEKVKDTAELLAKEMSTDLKREVKVLIPSSYGSSVQAMLSEQADIAYFSSIPYILANQKNSLVPVLAEERDDKTFYNSIFVVKKDAPYQSLADVKGKTMAFTSQTSTSGYVMARSRLVDQGYLKKGEDPKVFFKETIFAGGYDKALRSVLAGQADVAAVSDYTVSGPKANKYLSEAERAGLRILDSNPGVPTHLIAAQKKLSPEVIVNIRKSLMRISKEKPDLLADVYGASKFVEVDAKKHIEGAMTALENTGLLPKHLVK